MLDRYIRSYLEDLKGTLDEIDQATLGTVVQIFQQARQDGRQILLIGNGGSAATASHMACDLGKGTADRAHPDGLRFRTISLSDNNALISAVGNDISFDDVFTEQLRIVMQEGDVVVLISASGNSPNLVQACEYARSRKGTIIGLLGFGGGRLRGMVDVPLVVSSRNYGISEDFHLIAQHILTQYLRRAVAGPPRPVAFLDRDGVINQRPKPHEYVTRAEDFRFVDGVLPMLRGLVEKGFGLIVVTNQQGVGKGLLSPEALNLVHEEMTRGLAAAGVVLQGIFHCPHLEQAGCFCRKPRPGLIYRAQNETHFMIDMERSVLIGDSTSDMVAGRAAGLKTILVSPSAEPAAAGLATHVVATVGGVLAAV